MIFFGLAGICSICFLQFLHRILIILSRLQEHFSLPDRLIQRICLTIQRLNLLSRLHMLHISPIKSFLFLLIRFQFRAQPAELSFFGFSLFQEFL